MVKRSYLRVSPVAIIINRFETRCGACMKLLKNNQVEKCPYCRSKFTHVTTDCNPMWMASVAANTRRDLEYINLKDLA